MATFPRKPVYVSGGQFAEDIEAFLGGYPVRARTDTWGYRSGKFIQRHRAGFALILKSDEQRQIPSLSKSQFPALLFH